MAKAKFGLLLLGALVVGALVASSVGVAAGELNVSGTWKANYHCEKGWCKGMDFPNTFVLTQAAGSSTVTGTDLEGAVAGTLTGNTLQLTDTGSYKATITVTISADGNSWSGPGHDSATEGTDTATREGGSTTPTTTTTTPTITTPGKEENPNLPNQLLTCVANVGGACEGFGGMTPSQIQTCVSAWNTCDTFGGMTANPVMTCVGSSPGACTGFGGFTPSQVQVCVSNVQNCNGFGGMTPPQTQTCVSAWGSCEGFGGMTKPQIQTCVANVGGACQGFGPATNSTLQACVANVGGACQGFGPPGGHATTITPTALNPSELKCGDSTGKFLFDGISCQETLTVEPEKGKGKQEAGEGEKAEGKEEAKGKGKGKGGKKATASRAHRRLVLARLTATFPSHDVLVGRLAVINPAAQRYLSKIAAKHNNTTKLRVTLKLVILKNGVPLPKGSHSFSKTLKVKVLGKAGAKRPGKPKKKPAKRH